MIKINNITKKFDSFKAVDNVSIDIHDGLFLALLGPNGAGKTTLIRMLIGLLTPSEGTIRIDGQIMSRNNNDLKRKIGIVPQYTNLDKELTVKENLELAAKLFKLKKTEAKKRIEKLLDFVELKGVANRESQKLSGGMKRRLMIAKALINDPQILFLDEPTVGVDLNARRNIWDILRTMKKNGKTILMTTHYIEEAEYLCDNVALMNEGKIFYHDTPEKLKIQLGEYTVEFFNENMKTEFKYFRSIEEAKQFTVNIDTSYTLRNTTLEDVFYNFTNRKVL